MTELTELNREYSMARCGKIKPTMLLRFGQVDTRNQICDSRPWGHGKVYLIVKIKTFNLVEVSKLSRTSGYEKKKHKEKANSVIDERNMHQAHEKDWLKVLSYPEGFIHLC